jgi:hypothetical protein
MTTDDALACWGEPPTSPAEISLADFVHGVLETLLRGAAVEPATLRGSPELMAHGQEWMKTLDWVQDFAASVSIHSGLFENAAPVAAAVTPDWPDPFPGEFRIVDFLGEGAYGAVWLAEDLNLERRVALKTLKMPPAKDGQALWNVRQEARLLASVRHPNIVEVHAVRQSGEDCYLVLQYVAGGSLATRLRAEGPLSWQRAGRYVADVAEALLQVHARGIVHRDVNPANILWEPSSDEALLTDFGVSCRMTQATSITAGTLPYVAPEAFDGAVTPALDVFGCAATLFRLITGAVPFPAVDIVGHVTQVMQGLPFPDPRCVNLPPDLENLIRAGLAAAPAQRPSQADFVQALRGTLNRLLVDQLLGPLGSAPGPAPVKLSLRISKVHGREDLLPMTPAAPQRTYATRDLTKVPPAPERICLRTGERIRIQVSADCAGYVAVFNLGPTGNLNLLFPDKAHTAGVCSRVQANQSVDVSDVQLTPPAGRERLMATWSRFPLPPGRLLSLVQQDDPFAVSAPYDATRRIEHVYETMQQLRREDWHAVVLELDHKAA